MPRSAATRSRTSPRTSKAVPPRLAHRRARKSSAKTPEPKLRSEALASVFRDVAKALRPPPALAYSEWAEQNIRIPQNNAQPGRLKLWKFQRGIMDAIGDPTIERVTVVKPVQVGYTTMLAAAIGADAVNDPCSVLLYVPTDEDTAKIAIDDIYPIFEESPALSAVMSSRSNDSKNTLTRRTMLGGGSLKILSARSPRNLRSHRGRKIYVDEVDAMEITAEGNPIELAENRSMSFADRKIVVGSTPTDAENGLIWKRYLEGDQRIFEAPCPHCGALFELLWEHIGWPAGRPREAYAVCPHCDERIEERHKPAMVEAGEWRATAEPIDNHVSFKLNTLISLFAKASWGNLAIEFEKAQRAGPGAQQAFRNTKEGLPWNNVLDDLNEHVLMARTEDFGLRWDQAKQEWDVRLPAAVLYITAGVDVQPDRLEISLWGWSADGTRWVLGHEVIRSSSNLDGTWARLDSLLLTRWRHPLGETIGIDAAAIDSGDGNSTQVVYDFCGPRKDRLVVPIKGQRDKDGPVIAASKSRRLLRSGARLYMVCVDQVKMDLILAANEILKDDEGRDRHRIRFSRDLTSDWFIQFTSERRKASLVNGRMKTRFVVIGDRRNEVLDASVYANAVRGLLRFDFDHRETELTGNHVPVDRLAQMRKALEGLGS